MTETMSSIRGSDAPPSPIESRAKPIQVRHMELRGPGPANDVHDRLIGILPHLDDRFERIARKADVAAAEHERRTGAPLWLFGMRNHGELLRLEGRNVTAWQYDIGNPFTAESMTRHQIGVGLYVPLRVFLSEEAGEAVFSYDLPSDVVGQFEDARVEEVGLKLDRELEDVLRRALGGLAPVSKENDDA